MRAGSFLYAIWCLCVLGLFLAAASQGYSPFADGGRGATVGGFIRGSGGPNHK
jgi:hypothetical protein